MRADRDEPTIPTKGQEFGRFPSGRSRFVSAHFSELEDAMEAARTLEARGYERDRITVFMSSETRNYYLDSHPDFAELDDRAAVVDQLEVEEKRKTMEGAGTGGAIGGGIGAVGAAVAAIGTAVVVPPLGVTVAGPLAAALAGTGAGAAAGGLVGALVGSGISEYRAERFKTLLEEGHLIVGVEATTEAERSDLEEQLRDHGGTVVAEEEPATGG